MEFKDILQTIIYTVITTILPVLATYIVKLIKTKLEELNVKIDNEVINSYIATATDVVTKAVLEVQQCYVDSIKKAGHFDETAQKEAFEKAVEVAKKLINQETENVIYSVYGDFDVWLKNAIEVAVKGIKIK